MKNKDLLNHFLQCNGIVWLRLTDLYYVLQTNVKMNKSILENTNIWRWYYMYHKESVRSIVLPMNSRKQDYYSKLYKLIRRKTEKNLRKKLSSIHALFLCESVHDNQNKNENYALHIDFVKRCKEESVSYRNRIEVCLRDVAKWCSSFYVPCVRRSMYVSLLTHPILKVS